MASGLSVCEKTQGIDWIEDYHGFESMKNLFEKIVRSGRGA
jgi:hypothetical protein